MTIDNIVDSVSYNGYLLHVEGDVKVWRKHSHAGVERIVESQRCLQRVPEFSWWIRRKVMSMALTLLLSFTPVMEDWDRPTMELSLTLLPGNTFCRQHFWKDYHKVQQQIFNWLFRSEWDLETKSNSSQLPTYLDISSWDCENVPTERLGMLIKWK